MIEVVRVEMALIISKIEVDELGGAALTHSDGQNPDQDQGRPEQCFRHFLGDGPDGAMIIPAMRHEKNGE